MNLLEMQPGDVPKDTSLAQLSLVPLQPPGLTPTADQDLFAFLAGPVSSQAPPRAAVNPTIGLNVGQQHGGHTAEAQVSQVGNRPRISPAIMQELGIDGTSNNVSLDNLSIQPLSTSELGMILKAIQAFIPELPKIEMGDPATRASRLLAWSVAVRQMITPAGAHLSQWWEWCYQRAEEAYKQVLLASVQTREAILPQHPMPPAWMQLEAWMRPRVLSTIPKDIQTWVDMRARQGKVDTTEKLIFYLMKTFAPGGAEDKINLQNAILNPNACSQPRAAQVEVLKWKESLRRLMQLGCHPPDLLLAYRAVESIFLPSLIRQSRYCTKDGSVCGMDWVSPTTSQSRRSKVLSPSRRLNLGRWFCTGELA